MDSIRSDSSLDPSIQEGNNVNRVASDKGTLHPDDGEIEIENPPPVTEIKPTTEIVDEPILSDDILDEVEILSPINENTLSLSKSANLLPKEESDYDEMIATNPPLKGINMLRKAIDKTVASNTFSAARISRRHAEAKDKLVKDIRLELGRLNESDTQVAAVNALHRIIGAVEEDNFQTFLNIMRRDAPPKSSDANLSATIDDKKSKVKKNIGSARREYVRLFRFEK